MKQNATLTKREWQIASYLAWGAIKKEIAERLYISIHTVENHVRNIFAKTEVNSAPEFSAWYFCTKFNISMELSPLKNVVAIFLISVYLSGNISNSVDCARQQRIVRSTITITHRRKT